MNWLKLFNKKKGSKVAIFLLITLVYNLLFFPQSALSIAKAEVKQESEQKTDNLLARLAAEGIFKSSPYQTQQIKRIVKSEAFREITAYNVGDPYQCDGSPCISANGENICRP